MIEITSITSMQCDLRLAVDPVRPQRQWEENIGLAIAMKLPEYLVTKENEIYRIVKAVSLELTLQKLKEMREEAQEEFSQKINTMKKRLDELKLLQKIINKEEKKE